MINKHPKKKGDDEGWRGGGEQKKGPPGHVNLIFDIMFLTMNRPELSQKFRHIQTRTLFIQKPPHTNLEDS